MHGTKSRSLFVSRRSAAGGRSSRWSPTTPCDRWHRRRIKTTPPPPSAQVTRGTDVNDVDTKRNETEGRKGDRSPLVTKTICGSHSH